MGHPEELLRGVGRVRAIMVAVLASAAVSLAASPGVAKAQDLIGYTLLAGFAVGDDGALEVQRANGELTLSDDVPPSHRAWLLRDDGLVVEGQVVRGQVFIVNVTAKFGPATAGARDVPGVVTVVVVPLNTSEPCASGFGSPATADITYDDGEGRVETLTVAARIACQRAGTGPIGDLVLVREVDK